LNDLIFNRGDYSIGRLGLLGLDIGNEGGKENSQPKNNFHVKKTNILFNRMNGVINASFDLFSIG